MEHIDYPYINNEHRKSHCAKIIEGMQETIHHILARSEWWSNHENNKIKIFRHIHNAIHTLFDTQDLIGKIEKLRHIEDSALEDWLKDDIDKLIRKRKWKNIYIRKCIK